MRLDQHQALKKLHKGAAFGTMQYCSDLKINTMAMTELGANLQHSKDGRQLKAFYDKLSQTMSVFSIIDRVWTGPLT